MKTLQDKFAAALLARGEKELRSSSPKFRVFTRTIGSGATRYFLGRLGSVRVGVSRKASIPVAAAFKAKLLAMVEPVPEPDERHPDSTYEQGGT